MEYVSGLKRKSGIYQIRNTVNEKVYIGTAKCLGTRCSTHITHLKKGAHHSNLLQRSWNKHGEDKFVFEVIEFLDDYYAQSEERELYWINKLQAANPEFGYNIISAYSMSKVVAELNRKRVWTEEAREQMRNIVKGRKQKGKAAKGPDNFNGVEYSFRSPDGVVYTGRNVADFARSQGLCARSMVMLNNGQISTHKGWINTLNPPKPKEPRFRFKSPDGVIYETANISEFARQHGLSKSGLHKIHISENATHQGWTNPDSTFQPQPSRGRRFQILSPKGEVLEADSVRGFAKEHGLDVSALHSVIQGRKNSHRGYRRVSQEIQLSLPF